jgi:transcription initiation factor TFIIIB Brf1 subunit/transcription initiation factor TFIIB
MNNRLRSVGRRALTKFSAGKSEHALTQRQQMAELRRRMAEVEREIQESRRLNRRLAELTDIVQELLVPVAQRDEAKVREYLDRYSASL